MRSADRFRGETQARFWSKVRKTDGEGCWLWCGAVFKRKTTRGSYGCFFDNSHGRRNRLAHRFAYELAYGPIPRGMVVRHKCDVGLCVRPDHLELGTHEDNTADQVQRRAQAKPDIEPPLRPLPLLEA